MNDSQTQFKLEEALKHNEDVIANYNTAFHKRRIAKLISEVQEIIGPHHPAQLPLLHATRLLEELNTFGRHKMREHPMKIGFQLQEAIIEVGIPSNNDVIDDPDFAAKLMRGELG